MELVLVNGQACVKKAVKNSDIYRSIAANNIVGIPEILKIKDDFIFYRYINGETLRSRVENEKYISKEFIRLLVFSCVKILQELDANNISHNKLAPDNIIITPKGKVYLIDFEAAQFKNNSVEIDETIQNEYMSKELVDSKLSTVQNDIYSIGLILKELDNEHNFESVIDKCLCEQSIRYNSHTALLHEFNVAYNDIDDSTNIELPKYYTKWMMQVIAVTSMIGGVLGYFLSSSVNVSRPVVFTVFCVYFSLVLVDIIDYLRVILFENKKLKRILKFKIFVSFILFVVTVHLMLILMN